MVAMSDLPFTQWENSSNGRYYAVYLHQDLLGDWVVTKTWGKKGKRMSRMTHTYCDSYEAGLALKACIGKRRLSHGYSMVTMKDAKEDSIPIALS